MIEVDNALQALVFLNSKKPREIVKLLWGVLNFDSGPKGVEDSRRVR